MLDFNDRSDMPVGNSYARSQALDHHDDKTDRDDKRLVAIVLSGLGVMFALSVIAGILVR